MCMRVVDLRRRQMHQKTHSPVAAPQAHVTHTSTRTRSWRVPA